jgi:hypothetical protein
MNTNTLIASLMLGSATLAAASTPTIFPKPQQANLQTAYTQVTSVTLNIRKADSQGGMWEQLPADNTGAYALEVQPGKLTVWANGDEGMHYAKQTLSQMLRGVADAQNAQRDPFPSMPLPAVAVQGELPLGTVIDWPDLPFRGTVEGYYAANSVFALANTMGVEMPIVEAAYQVLYQNISADDAVQELLRRQRRPEEDAGWL